MNEIKKLLEDVAKGAISAEDAFIRIKTKPFEDLGFAKVDLSRKTRCGAGEVIYGAGKTAEQIVSIARALLESGEKSVLITRMAQDAAKTVSQSIQMQYDKISRIGIVGEVKKDKATADNENSGIVAVATGGTSDLPVAEEAALTAQFYGCRVCRIYDVGVAGLHRLLAHIEDLMSARVIIAVAGMEGALASVIGGLAAVPVIAVPTSVGYGASFGGLSALLAMLNSCASGVSVVNIDNGFGAGYLAAMINNMGEM